MNYLIGSDFDGQDQVIYFPDEKRTSQSFNVLLRTLFISLLLISINTNLNADGPRSKLINYNGPIGTNQDFHGVRVEIWINNKVTHENEDCHDLNAGHACDYYVYGLGMRIHNSHSHGIKVDLKKSLIFSQYPFTSCEAEIYWVDERGAEKKYRVAPGGFVIDAHSYIGIGAITASLGSSPQCFYQDRPWQAKGYNVNLYWQEIIPPAPPKQPPAPVPAPAPTAAPPAPVPQQPAPPPPPASDPIDMQKQMEELDRIVQRIQEVSMRALTDGENYSDAAYCRDVTDLLTVFSDLAKQDPSLGANFDPLLNMYGEIQTQACDRSTWTSDDSTEVVDRAPGCEDFPAESTGMAQPGLWCDTRKVKTTTVTDTSTPASSNSASKDGGKFQRGELKRPCHEGVAGCKD